VEQFCFLHLFLSLTWMLCLEPMDSGWAQDKTGDAIGATAQEENFLDLRGNVPNPRRIAASELHKLPRAEKRTTDPHDPGKVMAGGLRLESGMAAIRETVTMTVLVEASNGYRAAFTLAELDPELTDRVILLADTKDGQPLPLREGPFRIIVPGEKLPARWCVKSER
jgi:hypothetical protein